MWFYFALLSALVGAVATIAHRMTGSWVRPVELAWWTQLLCIPCSFIIVVVTHQKLYTSLIYLLPTVASAILCSYANVLAYRAYKYGEASVINPLGNLLPIGLILTSFIMFKTIPSPVGLIGVILIAAGVYYASVNGRHSLWAPFISIWKQRGSRAMLGSLALWSVSTNFDKIALRHASSAFYLLSIQICIFIFLSFYLASRPKKQTWQVWHNWKKRLLIISSFSTLGVFLQFKALALTSSSLVFAVKRLDTLIVILFAGYFLHEKHILKRFKGALIAVIGVVIIYLIK